MLIPVRNLTGVSGQTRPLHTKHSVGSGVLCTVQLQLHGVTAAWTPEKPGRYKIKGCCSSSGNSRAVSPCQGPLTSPAYPSTLEEIEASPSRSQRSKAGFASSRGFFWFSSSWELVVILLVPAGCVQTPCAPSITGFILPLPALLSCEHLPTQSLVTHPEGAHKACAEYPVRKFSPLLLLLCSPVPAPKHCPTCSLDHLRSK